MNLLMVPFFALFGAFLVDDDLDVRAVRSRRKDLAYFTARSRARRRNEPCREVPIDPAMYDALRSASALRTKSQESLELTRKLLMSAPSEDVRQNVEHLLGLLEQRQKLYEDMEKSLRQVALAKGQEQLRLQRNP
jgi:hypothetical protein